MFIMQFIFKIAFRNIKYNTHPRKNEMYRNKIVINYVLIVTSFCQTFSYFRYFFLQIKEKR